MRHVSHLRRSAIVRGFSHRFGGGLSYAAPTALDWGVGEVVPGLRRWRRGQLREIPGGWFSALGVRATS
jgi:hypothetical protein